MITCDKCTGLCCSYIVIPIETPEDADDYLDIFWYIFHPLLFVYIDMEGRWCVRIKSPCVHLQKDNSCAIYEQRPPVCKIYAVKNCERNAPEVKVGFPDAKTYAAWLVKNARLPKDKIPEAYV
jgi:Fe-S-cluster containining protein